MRRGWPSSKKTNLPKSITSARTSTPSPGSIYNGRVTRVLPGMQSSFVDIGLERDAFLYITDFMEEAVDSADFDACRRSPRPRAQSVPRVPEASGESRTEDRSEGRNEGRSEGRDGGRGRGRGRRDGRDSQRRRESQPEAARTETPIDEPFVFAPIDEEVLDLIVP